MNYNTDPLLFINDRRPLTINEGHLVVQGTTEVIARFDDSMQAQNCLEEAGWVRDDSYGDDWINPRFHEPPVHSPLDPEPAMTPKKWEALVNESERRGCVRLSDEKPGKSLPVDSGFDA